MNARSRYAGRRTYLVPADLSELAGPVAGVVRLPIRLDWSEQRAYDLSDDSHVGLMYERVIREASHLDDLRTYLNRETLVRLWPRLYLPAQARKVWETQFRDLCGRRNGGAQAAGHRHGEPFWAELARQASPPLGGSPEKESWRSGIDGWPSPSPSGAAGGMP
ncbi:hypothetical protein ACFV0L_09810 [Streptosporangium canum]|uniref:hypothetical protein n=1 Tax=Streptosporangium canum TaxID=324952 RepID=UPI0036CD0F03